MGKGENRMDCKELARNIKNGYNCLKKDPVYKEYHIFWNHRRGISEIYVKNDAGFKAIIIGNTENQLTTISLLRIS